MGSKNNNGLLIAAGLGLAVFALSKSGSSSAGLLDHAPGSPAHPADAKGLTPTQYILDRYKYAKEVNNECGVPVLSMLAHSGIETGFGKHAPGNNHFGMKAGSSWHGDIQLLHAFECGKTSDPRANGVTDQLISVHPPGSTGSNEGCNKKGYYTYRVLSKFRKYNSPADSFRDYCSLLKHSDRYKGAFQYTDPKQFSHYVITHGYATAPAYDELLAGMIDKMHVIMQENNLS